MDPFLGVGTALLEVARHVESRRLKKAVSNLAEHVEELGKHIEHTYDSIPRTYVGTEEPDGARTGDIWFQNDPHQNETTVHPPSRDWSATDTDKLR